MTKHKPKKQKLEKQHGWDETEDNLNPGSVKATVSASGEESEMPVTSQMQLKNIFMSEVKAMLYAYGDVRHPLSETAALVEDIVHTQMCELLKAAAEVAHKRRSLEIGLEEFLFLLRKNPNKVSRFVQRMNFLHTHSKVLAATSSSNVGLDEFHPSEDIEQSGTSQKSHRRQQICIDFLTHIDEAGELLQAATRQEADATKIKRLERAEKQTRDMSSSEYMEYVKCRQVTFAAQKGGKTRFREWFDFEALQTEVMPSQYGWDAIEYLAQETVAELVDLALLVQSETMPPLLPCEVEPDGRHLPLYASSSFTARAEILGSSGDKAQEDSATRKKTSEGALNRKLALKPAHIREAMRRFNSNANNIFLSKAVSTSEAKPTRLLCLP